MNREEFLFLFLISIILVSFFGCMQVVTIHPYDEMDDANCNVTVDNAPDNGYEYYLAGPSDVSYECPNGETYKHSEIDNPEQLAERVEKES